MNKLLMVFIAAALALTPACSEDNPAALEPIPRPPCDYCDLSEKSHVLANIEYAYTKRNWTVYEELLNEDFTFVLHPGIVGGGIPAEWNRATELTVTRRLFESNAQPDSPSYPVCRSVLLNLQYDETLTWVEVNPVDFPGDTWYAATLPYSYVFEMSPPRTLASRSGAKAEFTVRNVGTDQAPRWELVKLKDL